MQTYEETVRLSLEPLESEEIAQRLRGGGLTEPAQAVARQILVARGVTLPAAGAVVEQAADAPKFWEQIDRLCRDAFAGKASLVRAYWGVGGLLYLVFMLAIVLYSFGGNWLANLGLVLASVATLFHTVCVWRCAKNCNTPVFGQVAKLSTAFHSVIPLFILGASVYLLVCSAFGCAP